MDNEEDVLRNRRAINNKSEAKRRVRMNEAFRTLAAMTGQEGYDKCLILENVQRILGGLVEVTTMLKRENRELRDSVGKLSARAVQAVAKSSAPPKKSLMRGLGWEVGPTEETVT